MLCLLGDKDAGHAPLFGASMWAQVDMAVPKYSVANNAVFFSIALD